MLGALNALMEALAGLSPSIAVIAPYLLLAGLFTAIAAKLVDSEALFEAGRQACLTGLIVGLLSCLDYLRDPTLLGPIWELRRLHAILLPAAYYERYEQRLSLKQSFMALGWTMAVIFIFIGVFWLMLRGLGIELPLPPWLPTVMVKLDAVLALARLIALTWLFTSLVRLALSAKGGMGLLIGEANEQGRRKTFWFRRMYKPVRPKRNPHVLIVGTTGGGKSNLLKLLIRRALKKPQNVLVVDFTGEYRYLARHGFKVVDARSRCIDVFACDPHTVAEALRVAFPEAGELSAAVVETRLREAGDVGLKGFAETLIKESEQPSIASTTRSALRSIGEKLRVLASEVAGVGLDPRELLKGLKVLSLEGLLHDESKSFIAELTLRVMFGEAPCRPLSLTLVVDEAHRLIPPRGPAVEPIIVRVMREARKYGVKVYAATQSLKDLSEAAVGNFDTVWVAGGLVSTDRDFVARKWGDFVADASSGLTTGYAVDLMDASASRRAARPFTVRVVRIPRFREEPPIATLLRLLGLSRRAPWEAPEEAKPFEQPRRPLKQPRVKVEEPLRAKKPQIEEALRPEELRAEEVPVEEG
ncbi:MAG: hypothetical protein DRJ97_06435, partial [Thermoprotei archaeon]